MRTNKLPPKERTKIPRQHMPEQPAAERRANFREVNCGLTVLGATTEALRCLECAKPRCQTGCPVNVNIREFVRLGVTSIDSASALRRAWLGSTTNFLAETGWYSAVRIPQAEDCFRAKQLVAKGERTADQLRRLEQECLAGVRAYGARERPLSSTLLDRLTEYDALLAGQRKGIREQIRRTLDSRPWEACGCAICSRWGAEVYLASRTTISPGTVAAWAAGAKISRARSGVISYSWPSRPYSPVAPPRGER